MARSVRLRPWQKAALERLAGAPGRDFLAVATPGAGKTTFALTAVRQDLAAHPKRRLVVVVPTSHLKLQWASAALGFDLHLDPEWSATDGRLPSDVHGIATTYQQVASSADALRRLATDAFVVFDEIHHAGDERAWGDAIRHAFEGAGRRVSLSGTPFRSDTNAIPFVTYVDDEAQADYAYGYGDALAEGGVVRPVYFPRTDGHMEWVGPDGSYQAATFSDELDLVRAGQRLRTALSLEGEWLPAVLAQAHERLTTVRRSQPDAAGLVIAMDQDHARGIAELLRQRFGVEATVATSDDPTASSRIARFAAGDRPWIVAVRMVSEGVDIPRLRVGVFATNTTTELFFRQAVGRLVRWQRGVRAQRAWCFIPDDRRLRARAFEIAEARTHSLRRAPRPEGDELVDPLDAELAAQDAGEPDQLSLFAAISATPLDRAAVPVDPEADPDEPMPAEPPHLEDESLVVDLGDPPRLAGGEVAGIAGGDGGLALATRREQKRWLRDENAERAGAIVRRTGLPHAQVNAELNRLAGLRRITEATVPQLAARLAHADRWLTRLAG